MPSLESDDWRVRTRAMMSLPNLLTGADVLVGDLVCQAVHTSCLVFQAIILGAGAYGFISCSSDLGFSEDHCSSNNSRINLPWSASLMGMVAGAANLVYLSRISALEKRETDNTSHLKRLRKLYTLSVGMLFNVIFMLVDFIIMHKANSLADARWTHLYILATVEMIGGALLMATLLLHACKLYRVLRQKSQVYEVLNNLEEGFEDEYRDLE
ncbi:unnamed protein product [Clonostachys rhizophaga]|uniref:Transmembrane protein n=1 Tax=Clonostachys rhizophaga TaxID=160324 RepID=A0A9N9VC68_9HYPO|nr:unnamed protein product [Clonostachys rhizophaga]